MNDNRKGAKEAWREQLDELNTIPGRVWCVEAAAERTRAWSHAHRPELTTYQVVTDLSTCVDLCCERDLGGVMGPGCKCQGKGMIQRYPVQRREKYKDISAALEWCQNCEEPELEEQDALSHSPCPGEELPRPCPALDCVMYHGTEAERRVQYAEETARYAALAAAAELSSTGKRAMDAAQLKHAHAHSNVRWRERGQPLLRVPKRKWWLELLHSIALNAIKLHMKHSTIKYMPGAHRLYPPPLLDHYL